MRSILEWSSDEFGAWFGSSMGLVASEVNPESLICRDLGMDSFSLIEIEAAMQSVCAQFAFPPEMALDDVRVADILHYAQRFTENME